MPHPTQAGVRPTAGGVIPRSITTAPTVETIDNYDTGLHSGWTDDPSEYSLETSVHYEGEGCVRSDTPTSRPSLWSEDTGTLPRYFYHGEIMECHFRIAGKTTSGPSYMLYWAYANGGSDYWRFRWDAQDGGASLIRNDAGSSAPRGSTTATFQTGTWYRARVVRDDGTLGGANHDHTITVYEAATDTQVLSISSNENVNASYGGLGHEVAGEAEGELLLDHQYVTPE